jgi:hypothetical protein
VDRAQLARRMANPVGECRAIERQPLAGEDLRLAKERQEETSDYRPNEYCRATVSAVEAFCAF